jgi:hypothetical protein
MLAAEDERALDHVRHDGDALGIVDDFLRNALVGRRHDFVQNRGGIAEPVDESCRPSANDMLLRPSTTAAKISFFIVYSLPAEVIRFAACDRQRCISCRITILPIQCVPCLKFKTEVQFDARAVTGTGRGVLACQIFLVA